MTPFQLAERYIQLRKVCVPTLWSDWVTRISDMILMPMITVFLCVARGLDIMMIVSTLQNMYSAWSQWFEYSDLRLKVQMMMLHTVRVGGPFISTNDPTYMPYVFADAVVRTPHRVPVGIGN